MDITPRLSESMQVIQAYGDGGFKISNVSHKTSLLLFSHEAVALSVDDFSELTIAHFQKVLNAGDSVEIVLIGSGKTTGILPPDIRQSLRENKISVEVMDTGAACRTYNVLLAEGRRVAAVLIKV